MTIISLVKAAFGPKATLYTALDCTKSSSQSELRSAYRKAALRFHPDRANAAKSKNDINSNYGDTTLKFQAVSAAYQVLMDEKQRAVYNATGRIMEEYNDDSASSDNDNEGNHQQAPRRKRARNQKQQQWEDFFHSIFNEIISTGSQHESRALSYSGSVQEHTDVLKYYTMCKGNMQKVLDCIVHATQEDIGRWRKDIIVPAICRGEVDNFFNHDVNATTKVNAKKKYAMKLEDSSSSEDDVIASNIARKKYVKTLEDSSSSEDDVISSTKRNSSKLKRLKSRKGIAKKTSCSLVDTDDELEEKTQSKAKSAITTMSMRDKMDYRVAKKRKLKAKNEMEIAKIVQSKNWDGAINQFQEDNPAKRTNRGVVSDQLLSQIERKYATKSSSERRSRKR